MKQLGHFLHERCGLPDLVGGLMTVLIVAWVVLVIYAAANHGSLWSLLR